MDNHLLSFLPLEMKMRCWKEGQLEELDLAGSVNAEFGAEKYCMGYCDENGFHPCPGKAEGAKQCAPCAARDISRVYTRLDYSGHEEFYEKFRAQKFSVYLASFGHLVKCGVTRAQRLTDRVTEQGADYFCEIARAGDAEIAYAIEAAVHRGFPVRNGLTSAQKMRLLSASASPERIAGLAAKVSESGLLEGCEGEGRVRKLDYHVPESFSEAHRIGGRIRGCKGQIVFFENGGKSYAVNMGKKAGSLFSYSLMVS